MVGSGTPTYVPYATEQVLPRTIVEVAKASNQGVQIYQDEIDPSSPLIRDIGFVSVEVDYKTILQVVSVTSLKPRTISASCLTHFDVGLERSQVTLSSSVVEVVGIYLCY